jgi:hypothetical protein
MDSVILDGRGGFVTGPECSSAAAFAALLAVLLIEIAEVFAIALLRFDVVKGVPWP